MKKILISDFFYYYMVNGVTTVIDNTKKYLRDKGYDVEIIYPDSIPDLVYHKDCYSESKYLNEKILNADYIHLISEEPFNLFVKDQCLKLNRKFTTSMYTQFPEYSEIEKRTRKFSISSYTQLPEYRDIKEYNLPSTYRSEEENRRNMLLLHRDSSRVTVPTRAMVDYANNLGISDTVIWTIGVDTDIFKPTNKKIERDYISCIYYGRVTPEKNIDEFLKIDDPKIKKTIMGPKSWGYTREIIESYPNVISVIGKVSQEEAAKELVKHDVLVFPSHTDTFGLVMLEAMACGLPVAAFPNDVISEVIEDGVTGIMDDSLLKAIYKANDLNRSDCIERAKKFSWRNSINQFLDYLVEAR